MQITVGGARLDYDDNGDGLPIVLLHGFPLDRSIWEEQLSTLIPMCRVILPDLRGCGASDFGDAPVSVERLAADLAAVLDAARIDRAVIVGHSLGSYVAFAFLRAYRSRVAGFALVGGHAAADTPELIPGREQLALAAERDGIKPVIDAYLPRYFSPHFYDEAPAMIERAREIMQRLQPRAAAALIRAMRDRPSSEDLLDTIDVPSLVVAGAADSWITPESLRRAASRMHARYERYERCGHMPMMEEPERTGHALGELMRACAK